MSNKDTTQQQIEELQRQLAELQGAVKASAPPDYEKMRKEAAAFDDEMRALAERRMAHAAPFTREDLRAMEAACPTSAVKDIVAKGAVPERSGMTPSSQMLTGIRPGGGAANVPGGGTGWQAPIPLSPPPGIAMVDALCIADDVKQRKAKP
jgi:hypothetical protein